MNELIKSLLENKSLALLGFGREGRSTYKLIRKVLPLKTLTIIDENEAIRNDAVLKNDPNLSFISGKGCMQFMDDFDVAVKSPGIPSNTLPKTFKKVSLSSQTDIFLQCYGKQAIGVTGTKGKSTTSSLIYHILKNTGKNALLVGNIGIPPFDCIDDIKPDSIIVMELSSHQLEYISHAPHIAVFLNLFQEHLDHYYTYEDYQSAKFNIGKYQNALDYFIYNKDNETLAKLLETSGKQVHKSLGFSLEPGTDSEITINNDWIELFSGNDVFKLYDSSLGQALKGHHNLYNIMAAAASCFLCSITPEQIGQGIRSFNGLYPFLSTATVTNLIFIGEAGIRMMKEFGEYGTNSKHLYTATDYKQVVAIANEVTEKGKICLLSPAAASYDMFKNFEERGNAFKKNVRDLGPSHV